MNRNFSRWWFVNPAQWFKFIYEVTGGDKHPTASLIVTVVAFAVLGGLIWRAGYLQHEKELSTIAPSPSPTSTINQGSTDSNCSNVVSGGDVKISCPPATEKKDAPKQPPPKQP